MVEGSRLFSSTHATILSLHVYDVHAKVRITFSRTNRRDMTWKPTWR